MACFLLLFASGPWAVAVLDPEWRVEMEQIIT